MADDFMARAILLAKAAAQRGEVPVGAVLVKDGRILAESANQVEELKDPTAHAEIQAIRLAAKMLNSTRLVGVDLYVTLEPCPMCAAAIAHARIRRVYYGAYDPKSGGVDHGPKVFDHPTCHHKPEVIGGVAEADTAELLKDFFKGLRD